MTKVSIVADNSAMFMSAKELQKTIERLRHERGWSLRRVATESGVPYSWLVDLFRNSPQKPDMKRAQQVLSVLEGKWKKPNMTETESALFEAIQIIIGAQIKQGNFQTNLEEAFKDQAKEFEDGTQSDAAGVMKELLQFLRFRLPQSATPELPQSLRPSRDQSEKEKNLKNQP